MIESNNKNSNSFLRWIKKERRFSIPIISIAIGYIVYTCYRALTIRIQETGSQFFPATLLDWFAIAGTLIAIPLVIVGLRGIYKLIFKPDSINC